MAGPGLTPAGGGGADREPVAGSRVFSVMAEVEETGFVVRAEGDEGPVYLDDTGGPVHDPAEAKVFRTVIDAEAGLGIARLAPLGVARDWRIEPI